MKKIEDEINKEIAKNKQDRQTIDVELDVSKNRMANSILSCNKEEFVTFEPVRLKRTFGEKIKNFFNRIIYILTE